MTARLRFDRAGGWTEFAALSRLSMRFNASSMGHNGALSADIERKRQRRRASDRRCQWSSDLGRFDGILFPADRIAHRSAIFDPLPP
jgi:hypothetical protein